jgi:vacuolar-type H+-ATPase subunit H
MFSFFDPFYFPATRVVVVSEERLREAERKAKQAQIDQLANRIEAYETRTREVIQDAQKQLEALNAELAALPAAKE